MLILNWVCWLVYSLKAPAWSCDFKPRPLHRDVINKSLIRKRAAVGGHSLCILRSERKRSVCGVCFLLSDIAQNWRMTFFRRLKKEEKVSLNITKEKPADRMDSLLEDHQPAEMPNTTTPPKKGKWRAFKRGARRIFKCVFPCFGKKEKEEISTGEDDESEI